MAVFAPLCLAQAQSPDCGDPISTPSSTLSLPASVTGRVDFYAALYDPKTYQVLRAVSLGDVNALHPLASLYKPLVVQAALQDVDAGRLKLNTPLTTTAANRSIEAYPPGTHTLADLARRAIVQSDNTAADILQLTYGARRLAQQVHQKSPCTTVLLTSKAWWAAQVGLSASVLGPDTQAGAARYATQTFGARLDTAGLLIQASRSVTGPQLERALDGYFHGPDYSPALELELQNTSTAKAFSDLMARTLPGQSLRPVTRTLYRQILAQGCCRAAALPGQTSWAAKAGSGWRILNLVGVVQTRAGLIAYSYLNDGSDTPDAEDMERQIPAVVHWIALNLRGLL